MADNESTLTDEDGDTSDWIEIYNQSPHPVDLDGWYLTDRIDDSIAWEIPPLLIDPNEYLVIFASGKDRAIAGSELHTDFKLKSEGEYLALVRPDGSIATEFAAPFAGQYPDISYGIDAGGEPRYLVMATPGAPNDVPANRGPTVVSVSHFPDRPMPDQGVIVYTRIRPNDEEIVQVIMTLRIGFDEPRNFSMTPVTDEPHSDGAFTYKATIPASLFSAGDLVRYVVVAKGFSGYTSRRPFIGVHEDTPHYLGTIVQEPDSGTGVPQLHWFIEEPSSATTDEGTRAAVFFNDVLYDNVYIRLRGVSSRKTPKQSFKIKFNEGFRFSYADDMPAVDEINVNSNVRDYTHTRQVLAWNAFRDAGSRSSSAKIVRVQQNKQFFGLFTLVEQVDETYLERHGLDPEGALYKVQDNALATDTRMIEKKTRLSEGDDDLLALIEGIHLPGQLRTHYLFDNIDIPSMINVLAVHAILQDWDFITHNIYLYRDTEETEEWMILPWDKDLAFFGLAADNLNSHPLLGAAEHPILIAQNDSRHWNHLYDALYNTPKIREMYLRRLRTLMDELLQPPGSQRKDRYFEQAVDAYRVQIETDAEIDAERWSPPLDFDSAVNALLEGGIQARRNNLYTYFTVTDGAPPVAIIPDAQPAFPIIQIGTVTFRIEHDAEDSEYLVLKNPHTFAVDISGWTITGDISHLFRPRHSDRIGFRTICDQGCQCISKSYTPSNGRHWVICTGGISRTFGRRRRLREPRRCKRTRRKLENLWPRQSKALFAACHSTIARVNTIGLTELRTYP